METRRERFVTTKQFLQSARSFDITEEECILEALDNSFDAGARRVRIEISKTERDEPLIIIIDDGVGIPARHVDDIGVEHQGIPYVLAYGGRIPHEGKRGPIGKFGWGLSQAASSISRRTEVYTKTNTDDQWRYCYYDFEELEQRENCYLPIEKPRNPPWIDVGHTGTIVAFHMDRSDVQYIGSLVNRLEALLGRVYRKFLGNGAEIIITTENGSKKSNTVIVIEDPLHQMPESKEVRKFGPSDGPHTVTVRLDGGNTLGKVPDPNTGEEAVITIRICLLDAKHIRRRLGLNPDETGNSPKLREWGISDENQGFSILRNGREIAYGETLNLWKKSSEYGYVRAEIDFPEVLDDLFRVQVNKSRFTVEHTLKEVLDKRAMRTVRGLVREHEKTISRGKKKRAKSKVPTAERVMSQIAHVIPKPAVTPDEQKAGKQAVEAHKAALMAEAELEGDKAINEAKSDLLEATAARDQSAIEDANQAIQIAETAKQNAVNAVKARFAFESPVRKDIKALGNGDLYALEHQGETVKLTINQSTPFYRLVYESALMDRDMEALVDLLLFSMGWAEHLKRDEPTVKAFWTEARPMVSKFAHSFCETMQLDQSED